MRRKRSRQTGEEEGRAPSSHGGFQDKILKGQNFFRLSESESEKILSFQGFNHLPSLVIQPVLVNRIEVLY